jgi:hypothetical protein
VRIAQVVSSYAPQVGGAETHIGHVPVGLAGGGVQVSIVTSLSASRPSCGSSPGTPYVG